MGACKSQPQLSCRRFRNCNRECAASRKRADLVAREDGVGLSRNSASWDVTSDSLAAWLAGQIGARQIALVKHGAAFGNPPSVADLAARGIVDQAFPRFLASSGAQASIVAAEASGSAQKAISERGMPGTPIGLHDRVARSLLAPLWPRSNSRVGDGH